MRLRKATTWVRETVGTVPHVIVPAEVDAPETAVRKVTLSLREAPAVEIAIDQDPESTDARDSYWPEPPTNKIFSFHLLPHQFIVARAKGEGMHKVSVLVEYLG